MYNYPYCGIPHVIPNSQHFEKPFVDFVVIHHPSTARAIIASLL
jgi:hypothetical protein